MGCMGHRTQLLTQALHRCRRDGGAKVSRQLLAGDRFDHRQHVGGAAPGKIADHEFGCDCNPRARELIRDPVEVFHERCFIGFESDETLVYRLWDVFQDVAIWSSDYPHHDAEDAWDGLHHMAELDVPAQAQRKLMGENARRLYGVEPLMAVKERIEQYEPAILPW